MLVICIHKTEGSYLLRDSDDAAKDLNRVKWLVRVTESDDKPALVVKSTSLAFDDLVNESEMIIGVKATSHPYLRTSILNASLKGGQTEVQIREVT